MDSAIQSAIGSLSLATTPVPPVAEPARWYALQTRARHEKKVAAGLQEKGVEVYLPLVAQARRWSDRHKIIQMPLFPCYAFVHTASLSEARCATLYIWGVLGFIAANNQVLPVPDADIESVRTLLASKVSLTPYSFLKVGQRVRVRGGALDGIEGILVANGDRRLVISVAAINHSLSINIEGYDVEPI